MKRSHTGGVVRFAGGGYVWPAFQSGGSVDPGSSITYSPPVTTSDSSSKTALQEVSGLATSMGTLAGDVGKVSKGFSHSRKVLLRLSRRRLGCHRSFRLRVQQCQGFSQF